MSFLLVPSTLLAIAALCGFVLWLFRVTGGPVVAALSLAATAVAGLSPLGNMLLTPLDERFPEWSFPQQQSLEGIIVLGGSYSKVRHSYLSTIVLEDDTEPMAMMVLLARRYPAAKIIVVGGSTDGKPDLNDAATMKRYFVSFGIGTDRIVVEGQSQTIAQNAHYAASLLHPSPSSRWMLVAYGYRMPRAIGAFRKAGFDVVAFPVHLRTHGWREMWKPDISANENLQKLDLAAHEWLALLYYRLKGYTDDWFAGPRAGKSDRAADSVEVGHAFQSEAGRYSELMPARHSDAKPAT